MAQQTQTTLTDGGIEQTAETDAGAAEAALADTDCEPEAILGTHTYEGVLYSVEAAEENVPVNVLTGEQSVEVRSVEKARAFAEDSTREGGHPRVAVPQSTAAMIETDSAPYVSTVCYDKKVVRGRQTGTDEHGLPEFEYDGYTRMQGYRAAARSEHFDVALDEADYRTGAVTLTVERVDVTEGGDD
jgi:hypothetical protein